MYTLKLDKRYLPWSVIVILLKYMEHYGIIMLSDVQY